MLLDSNILIYAAQPEHARLRELIVERTPAVSAISVIEALGSGSVWVTQRTASSGKLP